MHAANNGNEFLNVFKIKNKYSSEKLKTKTVIKS